LILLVALLAQHVPGHGSVGLRNATERHYISYLFEQLGWNEEKAAGWLRDRHEIRDLAGGVFTAKMASEAIYQLEHVLEKERATARVQPPLDGN
jgi:hypothetical protein